MMPQSASPGLVTERTMEVPQPAMQHAREDDEVEMKRLEQRCVDTYCTAEVSDA